MTKNEIVETAFRVWGRDFYFHTSLSNLASELGVCKQALYRHFLNKNDLLETMANHFLDDFAGFLQKDYQTALTLEDKTECIFTITRSIIEYYARNSDYFIFAMVKLHDRELDNVKIADEFRVRGVDFLKFRQSISKNYAFTPLVMRLIFTTLTFYVAGFHKMGIQTAKQQPSEAAIVKIIGVIGEIVGKGLGYTREEIDSLDFERLEKVIIGAADDITDDPLLKAVAGAVAEAGPWEASMEQVARRSGLSKSSLYCHFKSKQDMLQQLFMTEFMRIINFSRQGIRQSEVPQEQLYLGIFSIAEYLRSKPDILITFDWIRNRKLNFNPGGKKPPKPEFESLRLFEEIEIKPLLNPESPFTETSLSSWILFLIVNTLMRTSGGQELGQAASSDIRQLYRLITLGIGGFEIGDRGKYCIMEVN